MLRIGFSPTVTLWLVSKRTCRGRVSLLDSMDLTLSGVGVPLLPWKPVFLSIPLQSLVIGSQMLCICTYICPCRSGCVPSNLFLPTSYHLRFSVFYSPLLFTYLFFTFFTYSYLGFWTFYFYPNSVFTTEFTLYFY